MAELVGSALLSAFFNVMFDKLATEEVKNFLRPKKVVNKLLEKLKVLLWSADKLLDDAEEKLIYDPRVENWHNELKDVVYKASELADKIETEALRRKLEGHQSARNTTKMFTKLFPKNSFDNYVKVELEEILSLLELLLSQKDALGLEPAGKSNYSGFKTRVSERFRPTPVADESGFCGREDIKETIIQSLRSADIRGERIAVIPIIGAGGLGKTTLAQIIYNHPDVEKHFSEARAWVTVSTEFVLPAIIKRIIGQVSYSSQIDGNVDQQVLLFKLNNALKEKKFLLVLDDVWSDDRDEWNNLKSCFESGERGSKIIVTTRSSRVASIAAPNQPLHFLPELPEEDCRRLFEKTVFTGDQDRDANPDLQEIGKKIVENCKGLPLSVKSVGGILRGDRVPETWESILKSSVWELLQQNSKNIIPSLWLSYRYLPSEIKPCFAYCCIFPKDYRFQKEEVIRLWMAEGFLKNEARKHGLTMEEVGKRYFEELISRSLFQSPEKSYRSEFFVMHDLVHDLAMYVSGKFCFWLDEDKMLHDLACETRHLSYNLAIGDAKKFEGLSKAKHLHTFVGFKLSYQSPELDILKVLEELSVEGGCLRVLSLSSSYKIDSLPTSVGKLKHLRYLNLSTTSVTKLPDSIGTLYNLQTLLLSGCTNLTRLPSNLGSLINLHHLHITDSPKLEFPGNCRYGSLKDLKIERCEAVKSIPMDYFPKLNRFTLEELECLVELTGDSPDELERLSIKKCSKLEFLGNGCYGSLKNLKIKKCETLKSIPLDHFPKLNRFTLKYCENFELFRFGEEPPLVLESLTYLKLEGLPKFVSFPEGGLPAPSLKNFYIAQCKNLRALPQQMPSNLESLVIWRCKKLAAQVMHWDLQTLTHCLREFRIDGCGEELLDSFPPEGLFPTSLTYLSIRNFQGLKTLNIHAFQNLKELYVSFCDELQGLPEESLPNSLSYLSIWDCPLLERRYRKETGEGWHKISHIPTVCINGKWQH